MSIDISYFLVSTPEICGGRLRIDGTRITVNQMVVLYKRGLTAEEIVERYKPRLNLAQVYSALAYYHANKEEVETSLKKEEQEAQRLQQELTIKTP